MGESNTVVSAYTMYRHLQQYCSCKCLYIVQALTTVLLSPIDIFYRPVLVLFTSNYLWTDRHEERPSNIRVDLCCISSNKQIRFMEFCALFDMQL